MSKPGNGFVGFMGRVGIICSALLALGTIIAFVSSFAWRTATQPIVQAMSDEREARQAADTLIIRRLEQVGVDVLVLGRTVGAAPNSPVVRQARAYFDGRTGVP